MCLYRAPEGGHVLTSLCARVSAFCSISAATLHVVGRNQISIYAANWLSSSNTSYWKIYSKGNLLLWKHESWFLLCKQYCSIKDRSWSWEQFWDHILKIKEWAKKRKPYHSFQNWFLWSCAWSQLVSVLLDSVSTVTSLGLILTSVHSGLMQVLVLESVVLSTTLIFNIFTLTNWHSLWLCLTAPPIADTGQN